MRISRVVGLAAVASLFFNVPALPQQEKINRSDGSSAAVKAVATQSQGTTIRGAAEKRLKWLVSGSSMSEFTNANGVWQDGMLGLSRDGNGRLWALVGHTGIGELSVWEGSTVDDLERKYFVKFNFEFGRAGKAFDGIAYPDGPRSRGWIWPFGLWVDPQDGKFYAYIHNETGYGAEDTNYDAYGRKDGDPDFRHIGLMVSSDQGRTWDFKGWIITSHEPSWTNRYRPDGVKEGQDSQVVILGAGDHSLFVNSQDGYMYIFYGQIAYDLKTNSTRRDDVYVVRAPIESKGIIPGAWKKYFEGSFSEPGNMGKETAVLEGGAEPNVAYNTYLRKYFLTTYNRTLWHSERGACQISLSDDLVHWTKPVPLAPDRKDLSMPYFTMSNMDSSGPTNVLGRVFRLFAGSNGTSVKKVAVIIEP
jgi:hypothetical protein